jgi:hypothetical protein
MIGYPVICDIKTLQQNESRYQLAIMEDPTNLETRLDLAWCLFMHALHEAGRENLQAALVDADLDADRAEVYREIGLYEQKAYQLLKGCLKETFTVLQLSPQTPQEVAKLHTLIRLSGADKAFTEAEDEAMRILGRLSQDIVVASSSNDLS